MAKNRKRIAIIAALILLTPVLALLIFREPAPTTFDLRDGSRLEILRVSYGTQHVAHFGNIPQKTVFKITGPRLSYQWVGHSFVTPAQDSINGTLGLFVRHRLPSGDPDANSLHNFNIQPVARPRKDHAMILSSGAGEYGLWELVGWTENHSDFSIENAKGERVARFHIVKDDRGRYTISEVPLADTQPPARDPRDEKSVLR